MKLWRPLIGSAMVIALAGCGSSTNSSSGSPAASPPIEAASTSTISPSGSASGIALVSADTAASTIDASPADLVILDVRTPEEFAEGHIDGAVMLDFYRADFADQVALLDPDVPYVVYCRSGNRSGQATAIMEQLGFGSIQDVDGGVVAWQAAGLPLVTE